MTAAEPQLPVIVVMGVSGSGKSTVGGLLAERLGVPYAEADDFHPPANIAKMSAGHPLDDADREPWLDAIAHWIAERRGQGGVVSCSALRRRYRDRQHGHASCQCGRHPAPGRRSCSHGPLSLESAAAGRLVSAVTQRARVAGGHRRPGGGRGMLET